LRTYSFDGRGRRRYQRGGELAGGGRRGERRGRLLKPAMAEKGLKVALYLRVSTEEQDLDQQRAALEAEVLRRGWQLVEVFAEKASGANAARPELSRLKRNAALNRFKTVLVWDTSRLGRDLLSCALVARELWSRGVGIVSYTQPEIDMSTPQGELILHLWLAFAQYRRREIQAATKRGMQRARDQGKHVGRPRLELDPGQVTWVVQHNSVAFAARAFGCSRSTIKRLVATGALPKPPPEAVTAQKGLSTNSAADPVKTGG
jgi:DNA invertase Pin-like site-specific DNA recombinase